jgi:hypothetical protein
MGKPIVWSYGMGIQSVAMAFLVINGRLPRPDRIIVADTGREFSKGWEYTNEVVIPRLDEIGLSIEIAPHSLSKVGLYSHKGEMLLPAYDATRTNKKGEHPRLSTFCSSEWKKLVVRRHIGGYEHNKLGVLMWLGMSLDEIGRLKDSDVGWIEHHYPLCYDVKMTRNECKDYILAQGVALPRKSRCWGCPHQDDPEWLEIAASPDEFREAVTLDHQIYESHQVRLHRSCQPLDEVVFSPREKDADGHLFDCDSGYCFV